MKLIVLVILTTAFQIGALWCAAKAYDHAGRHGSAGDLHSASERGGPFDIGARARRQGAHLDVVGAGLSGGAVRGFGVDELT